MPVSFSDFASVITGSLASQSSEVRALGERSYLLVADEYMNLNSRLAYHFSLVDACLSDTRSTTISPSASRAEERPPAAKPARLLLGSMPASLWLCGGPPGEPGECVV